MSSTIIYFYFSLKEELDAEYQKRLEENKRIAEEITAKKRAKRLKKKNNQRAKKLLSMNYMFWVKI